MRKVQSIYQNHIRFNKELHDALRHILPFIAVTISGLLLDATVTNLYVKLTLLLILALGLGIVVPRKPHWGLVLLVTLGPAQGVRLLADSALLTLPRLAGVLLVASLIPRLHTWRLIKDRKNIAIVIFALASIASLYAAANLQTDIEQWLCKRNVIYLADILTKELKNLASQISEAYDDCLELVCNRKDHAVDAFQQLEYPTESGPLLRLTNLVREGFARLSQQMSHTPLGD